MVDLVRQVGMANSEYMNNSLGTPRNNKIIISRVEVNDLIFLSLLFMSSFPMDTGFFFF